MMESTQEQKDEWNNLVLEIWMLAFAVDRFTPYAVFCEYSGHVGNLSIKIVRSKDEWRDEVVGSEFNVEGKYIHGDVLAFYKQKRDLLKTILEQREVDYSKFDEIRTEVVSYSF